MACQSTSVMQFVFYQSISNVKLINKIVVNPFHIIMHLNNKKQQFTYMTPEPLVIYFHCCILQAIVMALLMQSKCNKILLSIQKSLFMSKRMTLLLIYLF